MAASGDPLEYFEKSCSTVLFVDNDLLGFQSIPMLYSFNIVYLLTWQFIARPP